MSKSSNFIMKNLAIKKSFLNPKAKRDVTILCFVIIALFATFFFKNQRDKLAVYASTLAESKQQTEIENQALKAKLEFSAKIQTSDKTKQVAIFYITKYFGKDAQEVIKTMQCESGLNNLTYHQNRPGSGSDHGLYQLNDKFHAERFQKMYGVPLEIGAYDFDLSSKYAKYLFDNSGLNPWICSRLIH